nr:SPOR domain-containing protein [Candidatus Enterousia merdequi]
MEQEENLDLLDLEPESEVDALPEAAPFSAPHPKKPWLLMGLGVAIIVLATWIVVARIGGNSGTTVDIDLDEPVVENTDNVSAPVADLNVPEKPVDTVSKSVEKEKTQPEQKPVETKTVEVDGTPVRVVSDRKEVTFNPDKPVNKPVAKKKTRKATSQKVSSASTGSIYVQFGSYSTRALAQAAERKMRAGHDSLFAGKQFVILAAQVKGQTTYRLRVAFHSANEANGFCRNAKSDGLDCYVTK